MAGLGSEAERRIADALRQREEVVVAYLFGSRATGGGRRDSDVDVAVIFAAPTPAGRRFQLRCELNERVAAEAGVESADVVDLESAPPLLAHEVLRTGRLLVSRDEQRRVRVAARQIMRYIDTRRARRVLDDAMFRRLREGSFGRLA